MSEKIYIVSDLHAGSRFSRTEMFLSFLMEMPSDTTLILNGDITDKSWPRASNIHIKLIETIAKESFQRRIIWIRGNHDSKFVVPFDNNIHFSSYYSIDQLIYIEHGHNFTVKGLPYRIFIKCFRAFHNMLIAMGAEAVHVAFYAKNFPRLYETLCRHVRLYATAHAQENGFTTAICGHTHLAETTMVNGIRYFNTGSWTEEPLHYLEINKSSISLKKYEKRNL